MRAFLSRERRRKKAESAPVIPKVLQQRVNQRLKQISDEQDNDKIVMGSSEDSENSLLHANHPLESDNDSLSDDEDNNNSNAVIARAPVSPTALQQSTTDESERLLRAIGSDLSDSAYFEEDASVSSNSSDIFRLRTKAISPGTPTSLLGSQVPRAGSESPNSSDRNLERISVDNVVLPSSQLSTPRMELYRKILPGTALTILTACFIGQLVLFPTKWTVLLTTVLSIYCATLLWPSKNASKPNAVDLQLRRQELLAEGLPYKSRLLVAQTKLRKLEQRIKLLKQLEKVNQQFLALQQESALLLTTQVLLKSNKSASTTHLNTLTLSILPTKLATTGIKVQTPALLALAQSRRGSRYILIELFRELLSKKSAMFQYPPMIKANKRKSAPSKKRNRILSSIEGTTTVQERQPPSRLDAI